MRMTENQFRYLSAVTVAILLSACGGGGGDSSTDSSATSSSSTPSTIAPGAPTLSSLSAGDGQTSASFAAPASDGGASISAYTLACAATGGTDVTASGTSSPLVLTGLSNGVAYACSVKASNTAGTGAASNVLTVTPAAAASTAVTYAVPQNFSAILDSAYSPTSALTPSTSLANLGRYMLATGTGASISYLSIGSGGNPTYASQSSTLGSSSTYRDYFVKGLQAVVDASDTSCFRLDSELHSIYSLDVDQSASNQLKFRNNWGAATTGHGYLCFSYNNANGYLQAKKRYTYNIADYSHSVDTSFPGANTYYVSYSASSGTYSLVTTPSAATAFSLYAFPINVAIPASLNPSGIAASSNGRISLSGIVTDIISQMIGVAGKVYQNLSSLWTPQVTQYGADASTTASAEAKLAEIKTTAQNNGFSLRYDVELYKAFRNALLNTRTAAEGVANGTLAMNSAPYVYFTNAQDNSGVYHPFMVIASYSIADRPSRLLDVIRPPGQGGVSYAEALVTRDSVAGLFLFKIPMKDYGLVSQLTDNTMPNSLRDDVGSSAARDVYNYASISTAGVAVDGMEIYPTYNNVLIPSQAAGELTSNGNHVGQGMGIHYHADSQSAVGNDLALYNLRDYVGKTHPPLIGFGLDGVALFGRYVDSHTTMKGYGVALDTFGGHDHDGMGYHYHAHTVAATTTDNRSYTLSVLLKGAWRGQINAVPEFWDTTRNAPAVSMSQRHRYVGKP